jgi:hypothetical protein
MSWSGGHLVPIKASTTLNSKIIREEIQTTLAVDMQPCLFGSTDIVKPRLSGSEN